MLPSNMGASQWPFIARQGTLYNLTLDEVQGQLESNGKSLNSMNLEVQHPQLSSDSSSSSSASMLLGNLNINKTSSEKNVDGIGVWNGNVQQDYGNGINHPSADQQQPLRPMETALEEYLMRTGQAINNPQPLMAVDPAISMKKNMNCLQYETGLDHNQQQHQLNLTEPVPAVVESSFQGSDREFKNEALEIGCPKNQVELSALPVQSGNATSSDSRLNVARRRQLKDEKMQKSIEKRHKRMIKNRESAARSRARKQAHTKQLEHDAQQLKRKNELLERQLELQEKWSSHTGSQPCRYQLRRTSSSGF